MAASVWMPPVMVAPLGDCSSRSVAETTPVESEKSRPSGLPMATTSSPTATWDESPSLTGVELAGAWLGSILSSATSVDSSEPTMVAGICVPLDCRCP